MKKFFYTVLITGIGLIIFQSCSIKKEVISNPDTFISLPLENQVDGTNGSGIAFNPTKKIYYAVIAGNSSFPLEVFNANGEFMFTLEAGADCRGLWYDAKNKSLEANGYLNGLNRIKLSDDGIPSGEIEVIFEGGDQPDGNSCAEYDFNKKYILFYNDGSIYKCQHSDGKILEELKLDMPCSADEINLTSLIYTGYSGMEIGVLNCYKSEIYLFNYSNGSLSATINVPSNIVTDCAFKFDFANDYAFFYDVDTRTWTGMKIFK